MQSAAAKSTQPVREADLPFPGKCSNFRIPDLALRAISLEQQPHTIDCLLLSSPVTHPHTDIHTQGKEFSIICVVLPG